MKDLVKILKRIFTPESELELIGRTYPEALLYEEYKSKYNDKVKLMKEGNDYVLHKELPHKEGEVRIDILWILGDTISKENFAKYKYVMYCIKRYETSKPEPKEV